MTERPTLLQYDFILTKYFCNDLISKKRLHSKVLVIGTPTYEFEGDIVKLIPVPGTGVVKPGIGIKNTLYCFC